MTVRGAITAFLRTRPGEAWCALCVASRLERSAAGVANAFSAVEGYPGIRRVDSVCAGCGKRRLGLSSATAVTR